VHPPFPPCSIDHGHFSQTQGIVVSKEIAELRAVIDNMAASLATV
jgi:hypothetical protein